MTRKNGNREYRSDVFSMLLEDKRRALEIYNAFKYALAYLLRGARHAWHDILLLRTSAIRRRLYLGRRLDSHHL